MKNRKLPRLRNFDYSSAQIYFVTFNCHNDLHLLGEISTVNLYNTFKPSSIGLTAAECIRDIPIHYSGVEILDYVVMPNHIHLLISLINATEMVNLSTTIAACKSTITRKVRIDSPALLLWQKSFHDHIIRDKNEYQRIHNYIIANPKNWGKPKKGNRK